MEKKASPRLSRPCEADGKRQHGKHSHGRCPRALAQPAKPIPAHGAQCGTGRLLPFLCPGSIGNRTAIFKPAFSFSLQRHLNGFPLAHRMQGTQTSSLIVMGKVIRYKTKVKSSTGIPGTKIAACSPALTLSQGKEGSGYRQSHSRAHVPTLQQANTRARCEREQNGAFLP